MIEPTVGRIVNFWPGLGFAGVRHDTTKPLAAIVVHVFTAQLVNLTVLDSEGLPMREANVPLLQGNDKREPGQRCAEWMPYQKGQAAKTEALEQSLGPRAQ